MLSIFPLNPKAVSRIMSIDDMNMDYQLTSIAYGVADVKIQYQ